MKQRGPDKDQANSATKIVGRDLKRTTKETENGKKKSNGMTNFVHPP